MKHFGVVSFFVKEEQLQFCFSSIDDIVVMVYKHSKPVRICRTYVFCVFRHISRVVCLLSHSQQSQFSFLVTNTGYNHYNHYYWKKAIKDRNLTVQSVQVYTHRMPKIICCVPIYNTSLSACQA